VVFALRDRSPPRRTSSQVDIKLTSDGGTSHVHIRSDEDDIPAPVDPPLTVDRPTPPLPPKVPTAAARSASPYTPPVVTAPPRSSIPRIDIGY
jgi:hypothetical protein